MPLSHFPARDHNWCVEIERTHVNRIHELVRPFFSCCLLKFSTNNCGEPGLLLSSHNVATSVSLPKEMKKHVSRVFYLPHCCADLEFMFRHEELRSSSNVYKLSTSPKCLELMLADVLIDDGYLNETQIHPSKHTHILQCIYSPEESLFRWGVTSVDLCQDYKMVTEQLNIVSHVPQCPHGADSLTPVCRAYYKMSDIIGYYFPLWGWSLPSKEKIVSVDVGASPGGWTQYLSTISSAVLAVDPGELRPEVLAIDNVEHVMATIQSKVAQDCFSPYSSNSSSSCSSIRLVVCDMNMDADLAAKLLVDHVFPHMPMIVCEPTFARQQSDRTTHAQQSSSSVDSFLPWSYIILTLKLCKRAKQKHVDTAYEKSKTILCKQYICWDFKCVHLNANSINERTLVCKFGGRKAVV